ncbi:hypothetical protein [Kaistia sp. MMO-174]|uniref:hypothetical protein n=1 Tax=Kaistia sp. MMO-174 TaxID=3081256 RepID=UPI00301A8A02
MTKDAIVIEIIETAVKSRRINHPVTDAGTIQDRIFNPNEASEDVGKAILIALNQAGYEIVKKAD